MTKSRKKGKTKKELQEEIKNLRENLTECKDQLLRNQAEFENYRKQLDREKEQFMKTANENLIKDLLEIIDTMEIAINNIKDKETAEGVGNIYKKFMKILEYHGLKKIDAIGKKFDPYYHEAFMQEKSNKPEGTVLEEFQPGYMLNFKVIRHSKVKISK
ncbi:MAG TPA: nucleotide exchange factor GrpE [Candidatus Altiarchaeales archaeon]|nr:nucleotide exchange factor GrpE [Candidatus Altiarchaeales archaeon]